MAQTYDINIKLNVDSTELETASSELQNLENSASDATVSTDSLGDSVDNVTGDGLSDASDGADNLAGSAGDADNAIQVLGGDLDLINAGAFLAIAEEVGQLGQQAEAMAQEMNQASITVGQLATQTGIAEPQMVALINNISNATFPQDEAMMYVKSLDQIGVSSNRLGASATDLDRINDAFGLGANKVNSLGQELSVLGVDMNDVSSSFNALAYANANTVGGMDNYYNFLRRYDSQFKELGFNVDQASVIIAGATQKFGGGRAALTGLSEALKNADGDTRKLEEALGLQAGSLENASQITGEYEGQLQALADEEAEHKTILDQVGAVWEDISLTLSPILAPLGSLAGILGGIGQAGLAVMGLSSLAETLGILGVGAEGASAGFFTLGVAELSALWPVLAIIAGVTALVVAFEQFGEWMGWWDSFSGMLESAQSAVMRLWDAFINHPDVQAVLGAISGAWDWLVASLQPVIDWLGELWDSIFPPEARSNFDAVGLAIQAFGMLWDIISMPIKNAITGLQSLWEGFNTFYTMIQPIITFIASIVVPMWNTFYSNLMLVVTGVNSLIEIFNLFMDGQITLPEALGMVWNTILGVFTGIINNIMNLIRSFGVRILNQVRQVASNFVNGFVNGLKGLGSGFSGALDAVWNTLTNWGNKMIKKAEEIANWIKDKINDAKNFITGEGSSGFGSAEFNVTGSAGFGTGGTLNNRLSKITSNTSNTGDTINLNLSGIIDKDASTYIVDTMTSHVKKQNLIRGA